MLDIISKVGTHGAICRCVVCKKDFEVLDRYATARSHAGDQCEDCKNLPDNPPTQLLLLQIFNYDPDTGSLTYKRDFNRRHRGELATTPKNNDYLGVTLDKSYLAHRMIWLMQTGYLPEFIDHENHNRSDNSWKNLQDATRQANAMNKSLNTNNKSGFIGVSYMEARGKFRATITVDRKNKHLGLFDTAEDAHAARVTAEKQYGFHENHGKQ